MTWTRQLRDALSLADSPIGRDRPRGPATMLSLAALATILLDLNRLPWRIDYATAFPRIIPSLIVLAWLAIDLRGDPPALGLRWRPLPSWRFWLRAGLYVGALFAVIVAAAMAIYFTHHGVSWPAEVPPPGDISLWHTAVHYPVVEEIIYRWALVTALVTCTSRWSAVVLSGLAFGYLHFVYGVAAPNNVAAGFVFAWVYLRSGQIALPIALHSIGNLLVTGGNAIAYELLSC
ncbi:MAG: lysostaphin resistance A-like protein [Kofleriaceae bacterium]